MPHHLPLPRPFVFAALLALGCHTFPTDPDATRWDPPPSLPPIANFTGFVRDFDSDAPIAGVQVWVGEISGVSDATGFYNLPSVRGNQVLVQAWKAGYDTASVLHQVHEPTTTYDFRLQ